MLPVENPLGPEGQAGTYKVKLNQTDENGRVVVDPAQAKIELGDEVALTLKLSPDGTKVLWPQPTDSPRDPQNWSDRRKSIQLAVITLSTLIPGINLGLNTNLIFALAKDLDASPTSINNLATNVSYMSAAIGGIIVAMLIRKFGRLPVLFWSQLLAFGTLFGCTFAPNYTIFTVMRIVNGFFCPTPQVTGLYVVVDMYPFHLQTRKMNIWAAATLISLFLAPFVVAFLVNQLTWQWVYVVATIPTGIVQLVIMFFCEETIYDRHLDPVPEPDTTGLRCRIEDLLGITSYKMAKYRPGMIEIILLPFKLLFRPHMLLIITIQVVMFGFGLGIMITNAIILGGSSKLSDFAIGGIYATPVVALLLGEVCGRYLNDWVADYGIRRQNGIFEAEMRLWTYYLCTPIYLVGLIVLGVSLDELNITGIVLGWGIAQFAIMLGTVAGIAYANDCFPNHAGEVMALLGSAWVFGGVGISYGQEPWVLKKGAMQALGVEAAIVAGVMLIIVPLLQLKGSYLRTRFKM